MVGLFADHEGKEKNNPLARFGNISMLANPESPILWKNKPFERHIVDMHSRSGFSGSPVFVYRTFGSDLEAHSERVEMEVSGLANRLSVDRGNSDPLQVRLVPRTFFALLGIQCSQFNERWKLKGTETVEEQALHKITNETYLSGASGMSCVVPAHEIMKVLNLPKFVAQREAARAAFAKQLGNRTQPEDEKR